MADEEAQEKSGELEVYGELSLMPKLGFKARLARQNRVARVIASAASHAELEQNELDERLAGASGPVHDVALAAAFRAQQVDDEQYLDVLGRLIAGALDAANVDEIAYLTSEITKLEPIHLRALFGFFHYGEEGHEEADPSLGPAEAGWASNKPLTADEAARLLNVTRVTTAQILRRLENEGFIRQGTDAAAKYGPYDWGARTLSILFPQLTVEIRPNEPNNGATLTEQMTATTAAAAPTRAVIPRAQGDASERDRRAITALEEEIKKIERQRHGSPLGRIMGDDQWLATMKRRLRRVDPDNPWAYDDD